MTSFSENQVRFENLAKNLAITIRSYNKTAKEYSKNTLEIDTKSQIDKFLSYIPVSGRILDIGCGSGRDCKIFSEKGFDVTGIDLSDKLLDDARIYAPNANFRKMDILNMGFEENWFDGVWAMASLIHLEKKSISGVLDKCYSLLKVGGAFYFCLKRGDGESLESDKRYGGVKKYNAYYCYNEVRDLLANTKFRLLKFDEKTIDENYATKPWMDVFVRK